MEAVGATASLIALIETTVCLAKNAKKLYRSIEEAPAEIQHVSGSLELIRSALDSILLLLPSSVGDSDDIFPSYIRSTLTLALEQSSRAIETVQNACNGRVGEVNASRRLRWAFLERSEAKQALNQLHKAEASLILALQILQA